jgi:hypothetical protein
MGLGGREGGEREWWMEVGAGMGVLCMYVLHN